MQSKVHLLHDLSKKGRTYGTNEDEEPERRYRWDERGLPQESGNDGSGL